MDGGEEVSKCESVKVRKCLNIFEMEGEGKHSLLQLGRADIPLLSQGQALFVTLKSGHQTGYIQNCS